MSENIFASDVIRNVSFSSQYSSLIANLGCCEFREADKTLLLCPYDWRLANEKSAEALADRVKEAIESHGETARITLIGHSMGGLICRYFLESGKFSARPGFGCVERFVALATPHLGSPIALAAARGSRKQLFLSAAQVFELANDTRYPSLYQLLPPQGIPFLWDVDRSKRLEPIDIYDTEMTKRFGLVEENLRSAIEFHNSLSLLARPAHVSYFFFSGNSQTTATHASLSFLNNEPQNLRLLDSEHGGDGTVPIWSSSPTGIQSQFVSGQHSTIYRTSDLLTTLAALLGKSGLLAAVDYPATQISVRDHVVEPRNPVYVALTFNRALERLDGTIAVQEMEVADDGTARQMRTVKEMPIAYRGAAVEQMNFVFDAPGVASAYRLDFYTFDPGTPIATDELFVQAR
jgi:pimeloyl-ACP methyl ester carboxylesterase